MSVLIGVAVEELKRFHSGANISNELIGPRAPQTAAVREPLVPATEPPRRLPLVL